MLLRPRPLSAKPARVLRNVMERTMLDIMFKLPSMPNNARECLINQAVIDKGAEPVLLFGEAGGARPQRAGRRAG